jgi:hypothetical protein
MARHVPKGMHKGTELRNVLKAHLNNWHESRIKFLTLYVLAVLNCQSVESQKLADVFQTDAEPESNQRRIERFFCSYEFDYEHFAQVLWALVHSNQKLRLIMDRTNWKFGGVHINILTLSVCLEDMSVPLFFRVLAHRGNSSEELRIELMEQAIAVFGADKIEWLAADREFIGQKWFTWLKEKGILFYIRVKENLIIRSTTNGKKLYARNLFGGHPVGQFFQCKKKWLLKGVEVCLCGMRLEKNEYLIIACWALPENAQTAYKRRWQIETMFKAFKTKGFNLENTHIKNHDRIHKLMYVLSLAFIWTYKTGQWRIAIKPRKITHKQNKTLPLQSIFTIGLRFIKRIFSVESPKNIQLQIQSMLILSVT